jgi:dTDP-glucose 4,6-dehydratase
MKPTKSKYLITGCAGFIGSHLTEKVLNEGHYVYGVDKLSYCSHPELMVEFRKKYGSQFTFEKMDINDMTRLFEFDAILNICAESHVDNSIERSDEFIRSNITGVHNLLNLVKSKSKRPLFFQMSSDEIYGDIVRGEHIETDNYNPSNPYSFSKAGAELLVKSYARTHGLKYKMARATNTWGIRQNPEKLIPSACQKFKLGRTVDLHNQGTPVRTWLHVEDCVNGIMTIVEKGEVNETYNISGNYEDTNINVVSKIINVFLGRPLTTQISPAEYDQYINFNCGRAGQDVRYALNDQKLRDLGWSPIKQFDDELPSIVDYYRNGFVW